MSGTDQTRWWGKPLDARRFHVFEGEGQCRSLCQNWMLKYDGEDAEVSEDDEVKDGRDCKECARKAGVLDS